MRKKIFSRLMAAFMAVALLSTSAFAASFTELQGAINTGKSVERENCAEDAAGADKYKIEASKDEDGKVIINLYDDVKQSEGDQTYGSAISITGKDKDVTINMNGHTIDGEKEERKGALFNVWNGATLTINGGSSSEESDVRGTITGGNRTSKDGYLESSGGGGGAFFVQNGTVTLNDINVTGNSTTVSCGGAMDIRDSSGGGTGTWSNVTLNRVNMSGNTATGDGGAINMFGTNLTMKDCVMADNRTNHNGGAIWCGGNCSTLTIKGETKVYDNYAKCDETGAGERIDFSIGQTTLDELESSLKNEGEYFTHNGQTYGAHATAGLQELQKGDDAVRIIYGCIHANTEIRGAEDPTCTAPGYTGDTYCTDCGEKLADGETIDPAGHENTEWRVTTPAQPGVPGVETEYCVDCGEPTGNTRSIAALPMPVDFGDFTGGTDAGTAIGDEETPLAGILTLADLLNALYEHEEIEAVELSEDFQWADHVYAQAIHWGLEEALVEDTEEAPLDPDALLTVGLMREVLVNFVEYKGIDFTVTLDGGDEDLVLDLGERLTAFYAGLEKAGQKKAA